MPTARGEGTPDVASRHIVTGGGPARGTPGDDDPRPGSGAGPARRDTWRGHRGESRGTPAPRPGAFGDSWIGRPELEELPAQPVVPRGTPRLGLGGTLAVVAIVALLAAGFGVLGGRPEPEPDSTPRSTGPNATPVVVAHGTPRVSPWVDCASPPTTPPEILLEVNGLPTPGTVEVVSWSVGPPPVEPTTPEQTMPEQTMPVPTLIPVGGPPAPVEVPVNVSAELWIKGGACAIAWNIDLVGGDVLDSLSNPSADPAYAAQNRFALELAPYQGADYELRAVLVFPTLVARATWPIRVLEFEVPVPFLVWGLNDVPILAGCDVTLTLGSAGERPLNPCDGDLDEAPAAAVEVGRDAAPLFTIPGWEVSNAILTCGRLSGTSFVVEPEPGCLLEGRLEAQADSMRFDAPPVTGTWIVAISMCGARFTTASLYRVCGTWYGAVEVRD